MSPFVWLPLACLVDAGASHAPGDVALWTLVAIALEMQAARRFTA